MSKKAFIQANLKLLRSAIKTINWCTTALVLIALFCFLVFFHVLPLAKTVSQNNVGEFLKQGFTILAMLSSVSLQAFNYLRRKQELSILFALENIDNYESLTQLEKTIIDKVLERLTENK